MQIVNVDIQYLSPPPAIKYCKKCGKKTEYVCSGLFRVNAQRKYLDIWLIYKCSNCDSTWNMTIYSRINPKSIASEILEGFHSNNGELVEKYAMDTELIQKNGAEVGLPKYKIRGPAIDFSMPIELHIKSPYPAHFCQRNLVGCSFADFSRWSAGRQIARHCGLRLYLCPVCGNKPGADFIHFIYENGQLRGDIYPACTRSRHWIGGCQPGPRRHSERNGCREVITFMDTSGLQPILHQNNLKRLEFRAFFVLSRGCCGMA